MTSNFSFALVVFAVLSFLSNHWIVAANEVDVDNVVTLASPTASPSVQFLVQGWFYFTYYTDTACTSIRRITGYPTNYCFSNNGASWYKYSCGAGGVPTQTFYGDPNCQYGTGSSTYLDTCGSKQRLSCTNSASLPLSTNFAIVYTYKESTCINPISFEATMNGYCDSISFSRYQYPYINHYRYSSCSTFTYSEYLAVCSSGKRMVLGGTSPSQYTIMPTMAPTPVPITIQGSINIAKLTVGIYGSSDQNALTQAANEAIAQILQIDQQYITNLYFTQLSGDTFYSGVKAVVGINFVLKANDVYFYSRLNSTNAYGYFIASQVAALLDYNFGNTFLSLWIDIADYYGANDALLDDLGNVLYQGAYATDSTVYHNPTKAPSFSGSSTSSSTIVGIILGTIIPVMFLIIVVTFVCVNQAKIRAAKVNPVGGFNAPPGTNYPFNNSPSAPGGSSNPYTALGGSSNPYSNPGASSNPYSNPYNNTSTDPLAHLTSAFAAAAAANNNNGTNQPITVDFVGGFPGMSSSIPQQQPYNPSSTGYGAKPYDPSSTSSAFSSNAYGSSAAVGSGGGGGGFILPYSNLGAGNPSNASTSSAGGISMVPTNYGNGASSYNAGNTSSSTGNAYGGVGGLGLSNNLPTASAVNYNPGVPDTFAIQPSQRGF